MWFVCGPKSPEYAFCLHKPQQMKCLLVGCLKSQKHASVSQGWICSDNSMCCHTEIEAADQTFYLTQSQYTDTRLTSPCTDPIMPGAWQGSHWSSKFSVTCMTRSVPNRIWTPDLPLQRRMPYPLGQWGGQQMRTKNNGYTEISKGIIASSALRFSLGTIF